MAKAKSRSEMIAAPLLDLPPDGYDIDIVALEEEFGPPSGYLAHCGRLMPYWLPDGKALIANADEIPF